MSGIAGWIDHARDISEEHALLERMNKALSQRGPDDEGIWLSKHAGLTHRCLRIHWEEGVQPLVRQFGTRTLVITWDGRLYNGLELRRQLEGRGHRLRTALDAELILCAYAEWGTAILSDLNGVFSFALWDDQERQLFIARDPLGVKPLFYAQRGSTFLFGSELKALLAHPAIQPEIDGEGLAEVLALGPARTPGHGIFRGVKEVLPGHWLMIKQAGIRTGVYWKLQSHPHPDDEQRTIAQVSDLFYQAVQRQAMAERQVGAMLSGGLDSSAIASCVVDLYKQQGKKRLHTFSVEYEENERYFKPSQLQPHNDTPWVKRVSEELETKHHSIILQIPELIRALSPALAARDLPGMVDIDSSLYLFCQRIRQSGTHVVLSGEGADEIFGGYPWFHRPEMVQADTFPWSRMIQERMHFFSSEIVSYIQPEAYVGKRYQEALEEVPLLTNEGAADKRFRELFYLNLTRWMPTLLDRTDRMSKAAGVEVRMPFCDHHLIEYVWNVPWSMKKMDGQEKGLLRRALIGKLPDEVRTRRKSPYPKTHHPAYLNIVRNLALRILDTSDSPLLPFLDTKAVRLFAAQDLSAVHLPWFSQLLNVPQLFAYLIQLDRWLRNYRVRIC